MSGLYVPGVQVYSAKDHSKSIIPRVYMFKLYGAHQPLPLVWVVRLHWCRRSTQIVRRQQDYPSNKILQDLGLDYDEYRDEKDSVRWNVAPTWTFEGRIEVPIFFGVRQIGVLQIVSVFDVMRPMEQRDSPCIGSRVCQRITLRVCAVSSSGLRYVK